MQLTSRDSPTNNTMTNTMTETTPLIAYHAFQRPPPQHPPPPEPNVKAGEILALLTVHMASWCLAGFLGYTLLPHSLGESGPLVLVIMLCWIVQIGTSIAALCTGIPVLGYSSDASLCALVMGMMGKGFVMVVLDMVFGVSFWENGAIWWFVLSGGGYAGMGFEIWKGWIGGFEKGMQERIDQRMKERIDQRMQERIDENGRV